MPGAMAYLERQPKWLIYIFGLVGIAFVGFIDYLTGDYSILIFYLGPVALATWFVGPWRGGSLAILSGIARLNADYAIFTNKKLLYWNSLEDTVFLVISSVLIALLRKALKGGTSV